MSEGFEPVKAVRLKALKLKRFQVIKLLFLPPVVCLTVLKICCNFKAVSVALREVCLVKVPELWHFCSNQWFLFLLTNVIVITLAYLSGSLAPSNDIEAIYDEFIRRSEAARKNNASRPYLAKKQSSSQASSSRRKRRSLENLETQQQIQSFEAKSLAVMEVRSAESATFSAEDLQRRSSEKLETQEQIQSFEAKSLAVMEVPPMKSAAFSDEDLLRKSESNSLILMAESPTLSNEELRRRFDEFIANFKGRLGKEESSA